MKIPFGYTFRERNTTFLANLKAFPIYKETNVKLTNKGVPFLLKKMLEIDLIFTIKSFFSRKKYFDSILIVFKF